MTDWINKNKGLIIRFAFLIPIILVAIISISHVISWYNLANPISWAIYLSIAIEIAAMSSIAAASVKVKGFSVWFVFIIVTLIQFIGNIYFCYAEIKVNSEEFKQWVELTEPIFKILGDETNSILAQKRWLALLEGGLLPLISLTCLHFFIQYEDKKPDKIESVVVQDEVNEELIKDSIIIEEKELIEDIAVVEEKELILQEPVVGPEPVEENIEVEISIEVNNVEESVENFIELSNEETINTEESVKEEQAEELPIEKKTN
jgi:hypothetical protein